MTSLYHGHISNYTERMKRDIPCPDCGKSCLVNGEICGRCDGFGYVRSSENSSAPETKGEAA